MTKRTLLICSMLLVCVAMTAFLEAARRSWEIHSRLSVAAHAHVFYRVVHTTEMSGRIPEHYPIHTLESQRLVYSGDRYLGYLSKHGFFVPDGQSWDSAAAQDFRLTVVSFWLELLLGVTTVIGGILVVLKIGQHGASPIGGPLVMWAIGFLAPVWLCLFTPESTSGAWVYVSILVGALICAVAIAMSQFAIWQRIALVVASWLLLGGEVLALGCYFLSRDGLRGIQ